METIKQTLDNWLEEYTANKGLHDRLSLVLEENSKNNTLDAATVLLTKRDAKILLDGLNKTIQSNKESIMDCSYNIIQTNKNKNNTEKTEELCKKLEQIAENAIQQIKEII